MDKNDKEITNLELLTVSFSRTDSDHPTGVLTFKTESSVTNLLKDKHKCREKGYKLKESVPLVYREMQGTYRSESYRKYMKGYATWIGFEGTKYIMRYKKRDNAEPEHSTNGSRMVNLNQAQSEPTGMVL